MRPSARISSRPEGVAGGVRLPALRACRPAFVCPACGKVHPGGFVRLLWLVGLVLPVWWLSPRQVRTAPVSAGQHRVRQLSAGLKPGAQRNIRRIPRVEHPPGPSTVSGVLAVPTTAVVWNRSGAGTYLWSAPGGEILGFLDNGGWLELLDSWQSAGGVPFGAVRAGDLAGWADMRAVHRLPRPEMQVEHVLPAAGGVLYAVPGGTALRWLPPGTPLLLNEHPRGSWLEVQLLVGGESGWLPAATLGK